MSTADRPAASSSHALLRWLAVIPAAIAAGWLAHLVCGLASVAIARLIGEAYYVHLLLCYAPKNAAFVIAGAKIAPRQRATAVALAIVAIALSLLVHLLGQRTVGLTNYLHFTAESAGALLGAAFIFATTRTNRAGAAST